MKTGANKTDQNEIRRLTQMGWTAEEICNTLRIEEGCVKNWMPEGNYTAEDEPVKKSSRKKKKKATTKATMDAEATEAGEE